MTGPGRGERDEAMPKEIEEALWDARSMSPCEEEERAFDALRAAIASALAAARREGAEEAAAELDAFAQRSQEAIPRIVAAAAARSGVAQTVAEYGVFMIRRCAEILRRAPASVAPALSARDGEA